MSLTTNRYGVVSPSSICSNGVVVSTPIYISLPVEQRKAVLNRIREIKTKELIEMGWTQKEQQHGFKWSEDESFQAPPMTPVEEQLGCTEEHLRATLFSRHGLTERMLLKIQKITGIRIINRADIEATYVDWLNHLFLP